MEMWAGYPPGRADKSDLLSSHDRVAYRNEWFAEVKIRRNHSAAVVDVDNVAGEEEIVDQRNDSAISGAHRLPNRTPEIDTEVAAGHAAVEDASGTELARDYRRSGSKEGS